MYISVCKRPNAFHSSWSRATLAEKLASILYTAHLLFIEFLARLFSDFVSFYDQQKHLNFRLSKSPTENPTNTDGERRFFTKSHIMKTRKKVDLIKQLNWASCLLIHFANAFMWNAIKRTPTPRKSNQPHMNRQALKIKYTQTITIDL